MKPCSKNRKPIAWLILGGLKGEPATTLRQHLENCEGCRCYFNELSKLTATLKAVEAQDIQATESFHRRVAARIKGQEARSTRDTLMASLLDWRVALPAACGFALVLLIGWFLVARERVESPSRTSSIVQRPSEHNREADFVPTIANYQMIANRSLESFDKVLSEQARKKVPPAPLYTASALATWSMSD